MMRYTSRQPCHLHFQNCLSGYFLILHRSWTMAPSRSAFTLQTSAFSCDRAPHSTQRQSFAPPPCNACAQILALCLELTVRCSYMQQFAVPMLPHMLCEQLCSLNPGVDRYAFSTIFRSENVAECALGLIRLLQNGQRWQRTQLLVCIPSYLTLLFIAATQSVIHCLMRWRRFGRTIINNKCRLDYAAAQVCSTFDALFVDSTLQKLNHRLKRPCRVLLTAVSRMKISWRRDTGFTCCCNFAVVLFIFIHSFLYDKRNAQYKYVLHHSMNTPSSSFAGHPTACPSPESSATFSSCSLWHFPCARVAWRPAAST